MRRTSVLLLTVLALGACADPAVAPASGGSSSAATTSPSPTPAGPARVDLVEAGLRAVLPSGGGRGALLVMTKLCRTTMMNDEETCDGRLTDDEQAILAERLKDVADEIGFYPSYEDIPDGRAPIDGARAVVAWVGPPDARPDGTYWIEAGETCGGLCGHGGIYVLELRGERWGSTGPAPGTGQWIS